MQSEGLTEITGIYRDFAKSAIDFEVIAHEKKLNVEQEALGSDINRLASLFVEICENNRDRRDYTRAEIRRALREVAACYSVYRTYVVPDRNEIDDVDRSRIVEAISRAKVHRQDVDTELFDFIGDVLMLRVRGELESEFVLRFQQFTSPVMAKGVEDTVFYCFNRMIALNEVGGAPDHNGLTADEFHESCARMQATYPFTMNTLTTHDTKRSEDVRARLAVLTEVPGRWRVTLNRWARANAQFKTGNLPDRNTEYFLYQTLIGAWPISKDRLWAYMEKAVREAKEQTNWTQQNREFEEALSDFIDKILSSQSFLAELEALISRVIEPGRINSLAQTLIKYTAPGVPDTYQGSELWDLRLVDPDNRGPVDYELRQSMLVEMERGIAVEEIMKQMDSGMPKLWVIYRALHLRQERPECFRENGTYIPLPVEGPRKDHLVAYMRGEQVAVLVPRWNLKRGKSWVGTTVNLPMGRWTNILTGDEFDGGQLRAQALLERFPVGLLVKRVD